MIRMIRRSFPYFFLLLLVFSGTLFAQKQGNHWFFGDRAGVDFNSGSPVADLNGNLVTKEGCASISDASGNLLFYTDGQEVYDAAHNQMPNGFGLKGNSSSTQSGVIVPDPGSNTQFYIFTVDNLGQVDGMQYSIVDLSLNGGMGDVTTKNVPLVTPTTEKVSSVDHANCKDSWVITHEWNSNAFYAYQITTAGVSAAPVISNIGTSHTGGAANTLGYLKVSGRGDKICAALYDTGMFELFDFDNATGIVSNPVVISGPQYALAYGVEFSPDGNFLYCAVEGSPSQIFQLDLNAASIPNSAILVATTSSSKGGALQLASNGKIYFARFDATWLGVINSPNTVGLACDYVDQGVALNGRLSKLGLPTFIQSFFTAPDYTVNFLCEGEKTQFTITDPTQFDSLRYDFGDPASGAASNTSTQINPTHQYSAPGTYTFTITFYCNGQPKTTSGELTILPGATLDLGPDRNLCGGDSVFLDATNPQATYLWSTGHTGPTLSVNTSGTYGVTVFNPCDTIFDDIDINFRADPIPSITSDTFICPGDSFLIRADTGYAQYLWSTGSSTYFTAAGDAGRYSLQVVDQFGCKGNAAMRVFFDVCSKTMYIPTAFSPNGDGLNDIWFVVENGATITFIDIFDRWGKLIHQAKTAQEGWNGRINGKPAMEGVYTFYLEFVDAAGFDGNRSGSITLVR